MTGVYQGLIGRELSLGLDLSLVPAIEVYSTVILLNYPLDHLDLDLGFLLQCGYALLSPQLRPPWLSSRPLLQPELPGTASSCWLVWIWRPLRLYLHFYQPTCETS